MVLSVDAEKIIHVTHHQTDQLTILAIEAKEHSIKIVADISQGCESGYYFLHPKEGSVWKPVDIPCDLVKLVLPIRRHVDQWVARTLQEQRQLPFSIRLSALKESRLSITQPTVPEMFGLVELPIHSRDGNEIKKVFCCSPRSR